MKIDLSETTKCFAHYIPSEICISNIFLKSCCVRILLLCGSLTDPKYNRKNNSSLKFIFYARLKRNLSSRFRIISHTQQTLVLTSIFFFLFHTIFPLFIPKTCLVPLKYLNALHHNKTQKQLPHYFLKILQKYYQIPTLDMSDHFHQNNASQQKL